MQRGRRSPVDGVGGRRCCDNALCERLFATLGCERSIASRGEARVTVFEFVEDGYNPHRRRSSIGYGSSVGYDRRYFTTLPHATQTFGLSGVTLSTETGQSHVRWPDRWWALGEGAGRPRGLRQLLDSRTRPS
jgi:hypothetical protein